MKCVQNHDANNGVFGDRKKSLFTYVIHNTEETCNPISMKIDVRVDVNSIKLVQLWNFVQMDQIHYIKNDEKFK